MVEQVASYGENRRHDTNSIHIVNGLSSTLSCYSLSSCGIWQHVFYAAVGGGRSGLVPHPLWLHGHWTKDRLHWSGQECKVTRFLGSVEVVMKEDWDGLSEKASVRPLHRVPSHDLQQSRTHMTMTSAHARKWIHTTDNAATHGIHLLAFQVRWVMVALWRGSVRQVH